MSIEWRPTAQSCDCTTDKKCELHRIQQENEFLRGAVVAPPNTPDDLIRVKQENERLTQRIQSLTTDYVAITHEAERNEQQIADLRAKLEAAMKYLDDATRDNKDYETVNNRQADRIATLEGLLRRSLKELIEADKAYESEWDSSLEDYELLDEIKAALEEQ